MDEDDDNKTTSLASDIRSWILVGLAILGLFGGIVYAQIATNQTAAATAESVKEIKADIKEIKLSTEGLPQNVRRMEEAIRDQQIANGVQNNQINTLSTTVAETKIRIDNLERASGVRLRP